jgi:SurA-like N-terminal domain
MLKRNFWAMACVCTLAHATTWAAPARAGDPGVAAVVNGKTITTAELDARALQKNMKLAQQVYDARKAVLDDLVMEKLLAKEAKQKGVTPEALLKERLAAKAAPVTDADAKKFYDANTGRMRGRTLEQVSTQIKLLLTRQGLSAAKANLLKELRKDASVKIMLDAPRAEVIIAANDPSKGPKDAVITIVEFSDFQ